MQEDNGTFHTPTSAQRSDPSSRRLAWRGPDPRGGRARHQDPQALPLRAGARGLRVLPDAVYARGFLKTYANYLGLDGEELARELRDRRRRERSGATYEAPAASEFERPLVNPGGLRNKERRRVSGTTIRASLWRCSRWLPSGSLYYVGRGAQSNGESRSRPPRSEQKQAANGPRSNAQSSPPPKKVPREVPRETLRAEELATSPRRRRQPETLTVQVSVEGDPSWLSILADGELSYEQIAEPVSPRPSRRSARSA